MVKIKKLVLTKMLPKGLTNNHQDPRKLGTMRKAILKMSQKLFKIALLPIITKHHGYGKCQKTLSA